LRGLFLQRLTFRASMFVPGKVKAAVRWLAGAKILVSGGSVVGKMHAFCGASAEKLNGFPGAR
jgi:hypothetical protein